MDFGARGSSTWSLRKLTCSVTDSKGLISNKLELR